MEKYKYCFEPTKPIINEKDFTEELIGFCNKNKFDFFILHEGLEPVIEINGIKYLGLLQTPKQINVPIIPVFYAKGLGYKWVYLYEYDVKQSQG